MKKNNPTPVKPLISICIPVHNREIHTLIDQLIAQIQHIAEKIEICVLDDGSSAEYKKLNREIKSPFLTYGELSQNTGRAQVRNSLGRIARGSYCLFLDNDVEVRNIHFLNQYLDVVVKGNPAVICGSTVFPNTPDSDDHTLHWKYGTRVIAKMPVKKIKSLISMNFMIRADVLQKFPFNADLNTYGHEDTLMGYEINKNKLDIRFIDNPVYHVPLDNNEEYLEKNHSAVRNLVYLYKYPHTRESVNNTPLISAYKTLNKFHLSGMYKKFYQIFRNHIRANLLSRSPSLFYFKLFKLGELLIELKK